MVRADLVVRDGGGGFSATRSSFVPRRTDDARTGEGPAQPEPIITAVTALSFRFATETAQIPVRHRETEQPLPQPPRAPRPQQSITERFDRHEKNRKDAEQTPYHRRPDTCRSSLCRTSRRFASRTPIGTTTPKRKLASPNVADKIVRVTFTTGDP